MRDYQTKTNVGGAPDSITNTKYGAGEFNSLATENKNAVSRAGLTPADASGTDEETDQLAQSLFLHGVKSTSFQAGGTVDAITLTPVSGASGVVIPDDYDHLEGARISFIPSGANTDDVTISIGQTGGTQLSTKKALDESGAELAADTLSASRVEFVYDPTADSANGAFILVPYSVQGSASGAPIDVQVFTSSGTWNKPAGANSVIVEVVGGGGAAGNAGSGGSAAGAGGGGGGGGTAYKYIDSGLGDTETVTIGAAGAVSGSAGGNGGSGGTSSFGSHCSATGGGGGDGSGASGAAIGTADGGTGGSGVGGDVNAVGADGGYACYHYTDGQQIAGYGGSSTHGGGGAGANQNVTGAGPFSRSGTAGNNYGGGGGGAVAHGNTDLSSSEGAAGIVIVYSYS